MQCHMLEKFWTDLFVRTLVPRQPLSIEFEEGRPHAADCPYVADREAIFEQRVAARAVLPAFLRRTYSNAARAPTQSSIDVNPENEQSQHAPTTFSLRSPLLLVGVDIVYAAHAAEALADVVDRRLDTSERMRSWAQPETKVLLRSWSRQMGQRPSPRSPLRSERQGGLKPLLIPLTAWCPSW